MRSIKFPDMFTSTTTNITNDYDATLQNLKLLLASDKNGLYGDPYFGTGLKQYLFDQNDEVLKDLMRDGIYSAIKLFMPQLVVNRKDIVLDSSRGKVTATIKAVNKADFKTNLYQIVLLQTNV